MTCGACSYCFLIRVVTILCALLCTVCTVPANARSTGPHRYTLPIVPQQTSPQNQQEIIPLEPDKPIERDLAGGEKHCYQIALSKGQHASVVVEPRSEDVSVRLLGAEGKIELEMDAETWEGRKVLELASENTVAYQIEVQPKYPKARAGKYEIRITDLRSATERDHLLYEALRLTSQSARLYKAGAYESAQPLTEHALKIREQVFGPSHPEVALSLNSLGLLCDAMSQLDKAGHLYQRSLEINEKFFGKDHPGVAEVTDNLAKNFNTKANYAEAERLARQALSIREKALGPEHFLVAASLGTLGQIYLSKIDYANAQIFSERALQVAGKSYGPDELPYSDFASQLGRVEVSLGNYSGAQELFSQALHARETIAGKDSLQAADSLYDLAFVYLKKSTTSNANSYICAPWPSKRRSLDPITFK